MYMGVVSIRKRSHVHIPVVLVVTHVVPQHRGDCSVLSFDLPVYLGIVRRGVQIRYPQKTARAVEEPGIKLRAVVRKQRARDAILKHPLVAERNCDGVRRHPAERNDLRQLAEAVRNHEQEQFSCICVGERPQDADREAFDRPRSFKQYQSVEMFPQLDPVHRAGSTPSHRGGDICGQMGPVVLAS